MTHDNTSKKSTRTYSAENKKNRKKNINNGNERIINYYFLLYNPISSSFSNIFPHIISINLSLENPVVISRFPVKAKTLKIYLCVQLGGHGAHRANSFREFCPM